MCTCLLEDRHRGHDRCVAFNTWLSHFNHWRNVSLTVVQGWIQHLGTGCPVNWHLSFLKSSKRRGKGEFWPLAPPPPRPPPWIHPCGHDHVSYVGFFWNINETGSVRIYCWQGCMTLPDLLSLLTVTIKALVELAIDCLGNDMEQWAFIQTHDRQIGSNCWGFAKQAIRYRIYIFRPIFRDR